jgi:hypothetical protein
MHLICTVSRTTLYNMVLFLLSVILAAIAAAIAIFRHHISVGSLIRSEIARGDSSIAQKRAERSRVASPMKQFLVVVLPDGKVVTPRIAERFWPPGHS